MNLVKNIKKFIIEKTAFPIVFNFLILSGVSLFQGEVSGGVVLASFFAAVLQAAIPASKKPAYNSVGLEMMKGDEQPLFPDWLKNIPYLLILTPAISSISVFLGFLFVVLCGISTVKYFDTVILRLKNKKNLESAALERVTKKPFSVVIHVSGMGDVAYQINQWLPVLEQLDQNVLVMIRERSIYHGMVATTLPVIFARTRLDVEKCFDSCKSLKVVLYPGNPMINAQAFRHFKLQHCFINHGESDKEVNQSKFLMAYDKIFVGGKLAENRLIEAGLPLRDNQVVHVGRPQAEILLDVKNEKQEIKKILYAPTWEGFLESVNYSSVNKLGLSLLSELSGKEEYEVFFKPHPYTGSKNGKTAGFLKKMKELCSESNIKFIDPLDSIHDCMNNSDLLITDISSVMNEYLVTKKPIIVCNTSNKSDKELHSVFPTCAAAYSITTEDSILDTLNQIKNNDRLDTVREKIKCHSLGDFPEGALNRFKAEIDSLVLN